jgi:hypothetical protein
LDGIHVQVLCAPFFKFLGGIPLSPLEEVAYAGAAKGLLLTLVVAASNSIKLKLLQHQHFGDL